MNFLSQMTGRRSNCGTWLVAAILLVSLNGCGAKEAVYADDPPGVNRLAKPQIVIKRRDVYFDGHLIALNKTTAQEVSVFTGLTPGNQKSVDAYWDAHGLQIHATNFDDMMGRPVLVHRVAIWLGQDRDYQRSRPCTLDETKAHQTSVRERLRDIGEEDLQRGWNRDDMKRRVEQEKCSQAGYRPYNSFKGYVEVDGLPIGPDMTLGEIQARRKQLGLLPLINRAVGGPTMWNAPHQRHELGGDQLWVFEWPEQKDSTVEPKLENMKIKVISVP
jgi:hypothetical protein